MKFILWLLLFVFSTCAFSDDFDDPKFEKIFADSNLSVEQKKEKFYEVIAETSPEIKPLLSFPAMRQQLDSQFYLIMSKYSAGQSVEKESVVEEKEISQAEAIEQVFGSMQKQAQEGQNTLAQLLMERDKAEAKEIEDEKKRQNKFIPQVFKKRESNPPYYEFTLMREKYAVSTLTQKIVFTDKEPVLDNFCKSLAPSSKGIWAAELQQNYYEIAKLFRKMIRDINFSDEMGNPISRATFISKFLARQGELRIFNINQENGSNKINKDFDKNNILNRGAKSYYPMCFAKIQDGKIVSDNNQEKKFVPKPSNWISVANIDKFSFGDITLGQLLTIADDGVIEDVTTPEMVTEKRQAISRGPSGLEDGSFSFIQTCVTAADESLIPDSYFKSISGYEKRKILDINSLEGNLGAGDKISQHLPFRISRWASGNKHSKDRNAYDYDYDNKIATDKNGRVVYISSTRHFPSSPSVEQIFTSVIQKYGKPAKRQDGPKSSVVVYADNGNEDLDEMYLTGSEIKDHLVFTIRPGTLSVVAYNGSELQKVYQSNMDACVSNIDTYLKNMNAKDAKGNLDF